jgi:hypothetical protein
MKTALSLVTLVVSLAFILPAFAQEHCSQQQTKEACEKESCQWDSGTKTCKAPQ